MVLSGGAGEECGDDVGGVAVEGDPSSVVAHSRARIGMARGFLDVSQGNAGIERGSDERVAQRVGADSLGDPGAAGKATHDPSGGMSIQTVSGVRDEDRALAAFPNREVDRSGCTRRERDRYHLAAFTVDREGPMPAVETERFDIGAGGFGDPQPIERQQADQRVVTSAREAATRRAPTSLRSSPVAFDS